MTMYMKIIFRVLLTAFALFLLLILAGLMRLMWRMFRDFK
jgi:hypothetical protein